MKKIFYLFLLPIILFSQNNPNYRSDLNQKFIDLSNNYVILNINLKPGDEDINLLTNLRLKNGYKVYNLFFTRGETEKNLSGDLFGEDFSVTLSEKANKIAGYLDIENFYMNCKDHNIYGNKTNILKGWGGKELIKNSLRKILDYLKPDIIIISGSLKAENIFFSEYYNIIKDLTLETVSDTSVRTNFNQTTKKIYRPWLVSKILSRVIAPENNSNFIDFNYDDNYDEYYNLFKNEYSVIANRYNTKSCASSSFYEQIYVSPKVINSEKDIRSGITFRYREKEKIENIVSNLLKQKHLKKNLLLSVVQKSDQVIDVIKNSYRNIEPIADRIISKVKFDLSEIRFKLLDIKIHKHLSDSAVCKRQLFKFFIDSIENLKTGTTKIIFYNVDDTNWVIMRGNDFGKSYGIKSNEQFTFVTPENIQLNYPKYLYQYDFLSDKPLFSYAIIHQAKDPLYSFQYFGKEFMNIVEKADFNITPKNSFIKKSVNLDYSVTHFLNDPYKNILPRIMPQCSYLGAFTANKFSVFKKYDKVHGKIIFTLNDSIPNGEYNLAFTIGEPMISSVKINKFDISVDTTKHFGILTKNGFAFFDYFKSMNLKYEILESLRQTEKYYSIIVDENYMENSNSKKVISELIEFAKKGNNVIILDHSSLNELNISGNSISNDILSLSTITDTIEIVTSESSLFNYPNKIISQDFMNWEYEISRSIPTKYDNGFNKLLNIKSSDTIVKCGIFHLKIDKGSIFYIPISIKKQLYSVHPGSYKIFTNLLLYNNEK